MGKMNLKEARESLFNGRTYRGPVKHLTIDGVEFEVRAPRAKHSLDAIKSGNVRDGVAYEDLLIECVYYAPTGDPFFTKEHIESLAESSAHKDGILAQLSNAIKELTTKSKEDIEGDEKN